MKSAEQIAQHIADDFILETPNRVALIVKIREALTTYAEERVKEDCDNRTADDLYKRSREMGRADALEEAAKIAEKHGRPEGKRIAAEIRAMS